MQAYHVSAHPLAAQTCLEARWGPTISQVVRMMRAARLAGSQALAALPYSGEMARLRGRGGDELTALIELVFEEVRQQYYPKRISRLDSVFLMRSHQDAVWFHDNYRPGAHIYECHVSGSSPFVADFGVVTKGIDSEQAIGAEIAAMEQRAHNYWTASTSPIRPELLALANSAYVVKDV